MQDKTAQLLKAMTTVQIENAVRQTVARYGMVDLAKHMTAVGMTVTKLARIECRETTFARALGNAIVPNNFRMRPNTNMLAAIGCAVDEMVHTPADALEPHTVH